MLKQTRTKTHGTIGEFVNTLVAVQTTGTEQEKVYKALSAMENNGVISHWESEKFKEEYANGDYVVAAGG